MLYKYKKLTGYLKDLDRALSVRLQPFLNCFGKFSAVSQDRGQYYINDHRRIFTNQSRGRSCCCPSCALSLRTLFHLLLAFSSLLLSLRLGLRFRRYSFSPLRFGRSWVFASTLPLWLAIIGRTRRPILIFNFLFFICNFFFFIRSAIFFFIGSRGSSFLLIRFLLSLLTRDFRFFLGPWLSATLLHRLTHTVV